MSGVSSTSGSQGTLGDAPPVSFPGVASGIDYNSIIQKYTAETLQQQKPLATQANQLNSQNTAILNIKGLLGGVQDALTALSDPSVFGAYKATPSNTASGSTAATLTQIAGQTAIAGTVTINSQTAATATTIVNNSAAANGSINTGVALDNSGSSITATNGTSSSGKITINGIQVNYDVTTDSLTTILARIQAQTGVKALDNGNGTYTLGTAAGGAAVTTLGSGGDSGNLLQVLKLDSAQISGGNVTSSSNIGGINETSVLSQNNNAGFATAVTGGTFTINGVQFTVNTAKDSLSDVIKRINASNAGVVAQYNTATSQITLTSTTPGPQSILVGKTGDTSNFLASAGLTAGATTTAGTQAQVTYTNNTGTHTAFSSTNDFANIIPAFTLTVTSSSPAAFPPGSTFYTVSVASDPSQAEDAIGKFITAYNAAITELDKDLVAPTVTTGSSASGQTARSSGGGVLFGNFQVSNLRDQLVQLVSGLIPSGSNAYNSLASVGLKLGTASETVGTKSSNSDTNDSSDSTNSTTVQGSTNGTLAALDKTAFEAAYSANTAAVQALFTLTPPALKTKDPYQAQTAPSGFSYQLGSFIANANGLSTFLANSAIVPNDLSSVLLTQVLDSNNNEIGSLEKQITSIQKQANAQANSLRAQFSASESQIAQLQSLQSAVAALGR